MLGSVMETAFHCEHLVDGVEKTLHQRTCDLFPVYECLCVRFILQEETIKFLKLKGERK